MRIQDEIQTCGACSPTVVFHTECIARQRVMSMYRKRNANEHRVKLKIVPYVAIPFYIVQIYSGLSWNKLIYVPYLKFLTRMVQIFSDLNWNKLISVPYTRFLVRMVQIFSDLNWNKLVSVPYTKFLTPMVQPCHITYENSILWGSNLLV